MVPGTGSPGVPSEGGCTPEPTWARLKIIYSRSGNRWGAWKVISSRSTVGHVHEPLSGHETVQSLQNARLLPPDVGRHEGRAHVQSLADEFGRHRVNLIVQLALAADDEVYAVAAELIGKGLDV